MKKKSLINYKLFQNRKRFNPISLFNRKKDLTYKEFVEFLESKMVDTPGIEYYERVKQEFLRLTSEVKEKVEEVKQEVIEVKEEIAKIETSRQKRRSKRAKKNNEAPKKESIEESAVDNESIVIKTKDSIDEKDSIE